MDAHQIDRLFRGLTEGEFKFAAESPITIFNYEVTPSDLQNNSILSKRAFAFEFNEDFLVLGKLFPVGKRFFKIEKASVANPRTIRNVKVGDIIHSLKLNIFGSQIHHRFEKYSNPERLQKNKQKLEQYKTTLRKNEPEFCVSLLDEPLIEITSEFATEIVTGWLEFYDFPDGYTVGEPILEDEKWRVPLLLAYPTGENSFVTDIFVNVRTGIIENSLEIEEIRNIGKSKAKEIFSGG